MLGDAEKTDAWCERLARALGIHVVVINYPEDQYAKAHDTMSGKLAHGKDIHENEGRLADLQKNSAEFKARKAKYRDFIKPTVPERA